MGLFEQSIEILESCPSFLYSTQGKNPTITAPDFIFFRCCILSRNAVFSNAGTVQKLLRLSRRPFEGM
jgi:hypothetical protein